ncbi:MAG: response regulator transcription factor, partial [Pedobacter sp.]
VLLYSGDSTSRVLPVKKIADDEYQIRFENEFTFQPDSLVKIIKASLAQDKLDDNYIVNVLSCSNSEVIFGYAILKNEKNDIVPCSGRKQPKGCYLINLKFQNSGMSNSEKGYLIGSLPVIAFVGLLISRSVGRRRKQETFADDAATFHIGSTIFEIERRSLSFSNMVTELTVKETKLLLIFARSPNQIIERSRIQKEIWEDEGVIVGRSLDVFISKLRKKLEADSSIQLVNIHGKGYKLEIKSEG